MMGSAKLSDIASPQILHSDKIQRGRSPLLRYDDGLFLFDSNNTWTRLDFITSQRFLMLFLSIVYRMLIHGVF
ncbi:MAG TPA: hypothetical protein ENN12_00545 [Epsilonproteobacteria bacterium]|nr:hypothetical protein [Campylobacterota bacterium]